MKMRINTFLPNLLLRSPNLILGDNALPRIFSHSFNLLFHRIAPFMNRVMNIPHSGRHKAYPKFAVDITTRCVTMRKTTIKVIDNGMRMFMGGGDWSIFPINWEDYYSLVSRE
jgi:hypothetical protein